MAEPQVTNYGEIQDNEIEALHSIFMDDFEEEKVKPGAWNKQADKSFTLRLRPTGVTSSDDSDHATAQLRVSLPATYPKTVPNCQVKFDDHLSTKARQAIDILLRTKPRSMIGSEMIYDLASSISEILSDAAVSALKTKGLPALDEERAKQEAAAREKAEEERKLQEQKQQVAEEEENRALSDMVKMERSRVARKTRQRSYQSEGLSSTWSDTFEGDMNFDQEIKIKIPESSTVIAFRAIMNKTLYRNGSVTKVYTAVPAVPEELSRETCPSLILKCCTVKAQKQDVQNLESKLESLLALPSNSSVLQPLAFRILKNTEGQNDWTINILSSFAQGRSLGDLLEVVTSLDVKNLRSWTIQLLEGLDFLHRHRFVHARITPQNILLERTESGATVIKISDASYQHDLHTMNNDTSTKFSSATSAYWVAPESASRSQGLVGLPKDIWDVGVLILQMAFGLDVKRQYNSPSSLLESLTLSQSFEEMMLLIFKADPKKRPSAFDLLPSSFLRDNDPILDNETSEYVSRVQSLSSSHTPMLKSTRLRHDSSHAPPSMSRYANDFVESGRLGKGGFGQVVRARNKLDGTTYAIKKISQTSIAALNGVLSEVMLLSKLNNAYIVRYYTAWIEEEGPVQSAEDSDVSSLDDEELTTSVSKLPTSGTRGLDFISSSRGYPEIEFGYDTDEEVDSEAIEYDNSETPEQDDEDSSPKPPTNSLAQRRRSSVSAPSKVTLYIQMEYCEKQTLRDLIRDLPSDVPECWRLFRQILEGLAHVHSNGVIHRDLKPENIFMSTDESNSIRVRIGDFGLARPGEASGRNVPKGFVDPRLTASIGTSLYVAPEVKSSGGGSYNAKADMYSLGIILFEMSYPLKTAMERASIIGELRKPGYVLPPAFQDSEKILQGDIVVSLVKHKVSERPSSQELLRSGRIPSQVEDETIRNALSSLTDKSSPFYTKLMSGIFSQKKEEQSARDYTYDFELGLTSHTTDDLMLQLLIKESLTGVFRRHGAVESRRQTLVPSSRHYDSAVRLLDASGELVQLNFDLTFPFARTLAKQSNTIGKFYSFGNVYREAPAGLHPRSHGEVDFDIATNDSLDLALREAEVIKVIDEISDSLPSLANATLVYHITHSKLIDAILSFCGIPEKSTIKQIISRLNIGQFTWSKIRNELRSPAIGVASTSLDDLMKFNFREEYKEAIPKLRSLLQDTEELESTFRHLEAVCAYLERFRVRRKVYISPLSSHNEKFYRGNLLFQCISEEKRRRVICAGGRYDRLIQELRTERGNIHAVGFNLAWENLVDSMVKYQQKKSPSKHFLKKSEDETVGGLWKQRRCDVLIDSSDPAILRSRGIKIVQELWANSISAELVIDSSVREYTSYQYQSRDDNDGHDWIVLIKQDETLRVRSAVSKDDVEIRSSELISFLKGELRERARQEGAFQTAGKQQQHLGDTMNGDREVDVSIVTVAHKGKKAKRQAIVEDAQERTAEFASSLLAAPIIAVEMKDDLFETLRETRLSDPDSWRRYIQSAPLTDRSYLSDLHRHLLDKSQENEDQRNSFLYNFRTRTCFYYDMGSAKNS